MPKFKSMRHRVEFAYTEMNTDIYYEGDFKYTIEDHNNNLVFEMLEENQMDHILSVIWQRNQAAKLAVN